MRAVSSEDPGISRSRVASIPVQRDGSCGKVDSKAIFGQEARPDEQRGTVAERRLGSEDAAIEWEINEIQILFNSPVCGEKRGRAADKLSVDMTSQLLG